MAATVWMRHPNLPPEQLIQVPESSIPHHQAGGWEVTEAPPKPKSAPRKAAESADSVPLAPQPEADGESVVLDDAPEDPAPDAEAATAPKRPRKTTPKAEES
ncbi:hypothetical protein OG352_05190 [Streptomyces sp. NBC_01485]|uniref:hypothetical protein n=1 Tax=Streptomyces sp. NBC_01485 TaxID=2903884 RepID=UPI002E32FD46|nr:hypothetical protein [Streptomyces sp. NBC_01485]